MTEPNPTVQQRAQSPPGSIPKGRQTYMMIGVALVIILAVVFSGPIPSQPNGTGQKLPSMAVNTPSKAEIDRYTKAMRAEEERLRQAQAETARRTAVPPPTAGVPGEAAMGPNGQSYYPAGYPQPPAPVDLIQQDRKKREYASLFASNVALSYRKEVAELSTAGTSAASGANKPSGAPTQGTEDQEASASAPPAGHTVFEGAILEAVLTNRLEGSFAGPVNCQITTAVYSRDRQHLLIPKGSRVLGQARKVDDRDQERLAVTFHRLIMPDGYSVSLNQFQGLDQQGATALKDKVNNHYLAKFGTSIALGALAGFSLYGARGGWDYGGTDMYRQGVATQLGRDATQILDRQLNRVPTITIREGTRVRIYLAADIKLAAYDDPTKGEPQQ